MRLLIVGSTAPWAIELHYIRHFKENGVELEVFDPSHFINYSGFNRVLIRLGSLAPYRAANENLLDTFRRFRPDVVWVFKGIEFNPETLARIKQQGIKLVNYNPDHPFIRTAISHGGKNIAESVPLYDLHFCYSRDLAARIEKEFGIPTAYLPFGFDLDVSVYERVAGAQEILRACFIGNPDPIRARIIRQLGRSGIPVDVYGHHWKRFLRSDAHINVFGPVHGEVFWQKIRQYRVQINIFRPHNAGSHNMRTFEIPAAGGIMLAPDNPEHRSFFEHSREAFFYQSEDDIAGCCREILAMNAVGHIRENARRRSVEGGYSYSHRAASALGAIQRV